MANCAEHPRSEARATCTSCNRLLCAECVAVPLDSNEARCAHCNGVTTPLARAPIAVAPPAHLRAALPSAAVVASGTAVLDDDVSPVTRITSFMFARETLLTLFALTVFTTILRGLASNAFGVTGFAIALVATGLEISYYFRVLTSVAWGERDFRSPDFSSLGEDVIDPLIRYVATLVPMIIAVFWLGEVTTGHWLHGFVLVAVRPDVIFNYAGPGLLFAAWLALWPLMTVIAAIGKSIITTYNPVTWMRTLAMLKMRYVVGAVVFYGLLVAEAYAIAPLGGVLAVPYLGALVAALVANFAMAVRGCVLGIVCEPYSR